MASSGLNLRLRGTVYWFRRRVPDSLVERVGRKEILRSLDTSSRAEAGLRARAAWLVTERIFGLVRSGKTITREQIDLLLRRLVRESVWNSPSRDELVEDFAKKQDSIADVLFSEEGRSAILGLPSVDREKVLQHLERFLDLASARTHEAIAEAADIRAEVAELRRFRAEKREGDARIVAAAAQFMQLEERKRLAASDAELPVLAPPRLVGRKTGVATEPFAAHQRAYLDSRRTKNDDFDALTPNSIGQAERTFEVWQELMGDMPVGAVTRVEARRFRSLLRTLPASYGKAAHAVRPLTLREEIERARARQEAIDRRNAALPPGADREPDVPLLALKTAKRHLSALSAYWQWLEMQGHAAEGSNPFVGFKWPGVRKGRQGIKRHQEPIQGRH